MGYLIRDFIPLQKGRVWNDAVRIFIIGFGFKKNGFELYGMLIIYWLLRVFQVFDSICQS